MTRDVTDRFLLSLVPDSMDALRFARWHGWLPDLDRLEADVTSLLQDDCEKPRRLAGGAPWADLLAARLDPAARATLQRRYGDALRVEPDITFSHQAGPMGARRLAGRTESVAPEGAAADGSLLHFRITDDDGLPLAGVGLHAEGAGLGAGLWAVTDDHGLARLALASENPAAVRCLTLLPPTRYWGRRLMRPVLRQTPPGAPARVNTLALRSLDTPFGTLPEWGIEAMGLDRAPHLTVPGTRKVRVAVLDPGAAPPPFVVAPIDSGALVEDWSPAGAPPSPAASLIDAAAPGVCLRILRMGATPGASDLIAAIDWCLAVGIDLLDLGFAAASPAPALARTLARARARGLVVIAPGGDSGGPVHWPAAEPGVLAVGALASRAACPPDAPGATRSTCAPAAFSACDSSLDVVAPGAALVLPTADGPAALDGTALASALVTGFLARLLQTQPELATLPVGRRRAEALCAALRARCHALALPEIPGGAGLPLWDALLAADDPTGDAPIATDAPQRDRVTGAGLPA